MDQWAYRDERLLLELLQDGVGKRIDIIPCSHALTQSDQREWLGSLECDIIKWDIVSMSGLLYTGNQSLEPRLLFGDNLLLGSHSLIQECFNRFHVMGSQQLCDFIQRKAAIFECHDSHHICELFQFIQAIARLWVDVRWSQNIEGVVMSQGF